MKKDRKKKLPRVLNRIRTVREGFNVEAATVAADLNINYYGLLRRELQEQPITLDMLGALADYFGVDIIELIEPRTVDGRKKKVGKHLG